ncbi:hypothetical protein [Antrihabitans cavernicola]|uniref:Ig-like domain-containing protein n=1 Tax=Antrihabitans cavernicola TaxID=2495913 RepID=A0A5A7SI32_9NOCA|nr:hypothetical protein [Spelaeibacter cavernicola]KAA0023881.1 hypothetical protein FOY51_04655 [Spelaeibacter cavernicola]
MSNMRTTRRAAAVVALTAAAGLAVPAIASAGSVIPTPTVLCPGASAVASGGSVAVGAISAPNPVTSSNVSYAWIALDPNFVGVTPLAPSGSTVVGSAPNAPGVGIVYGSYTSSTGTCTLTPAVVLQP